MQCPMCNGRTQREAQPGRPKRYVCTDCGWGEVERDVAEQVMGNAASFYLKLSLVWLITPVVLVGPYLGLRYLASEASTFINADDFVAKLNLHYWWVLGVYLLACWVFSPTYDADNLGIFGGNPSSRYNPAFTGEQHHNRTMRKLGTLLMPGKIVLMAFATTFNLLRGRCPPPSSPLPLAPGATGGLPTSAFCRPPGTTG